MNNHPAHRQARVGHLMLEVGDGRTHYVGIAIKGGKRELAETGLEVSPALRRHQDPNVHEILARARASTGQAFAR